MSTNYYRWYKMYEKDYDLYLERVAFAFDAIMLGVIGLDEVVDGIDFAACHANEVPPRVAAALAVEDNGFGAMLTRKDAELLEEGWL
jgi:hypothetical protein